MTRHASRTRREGHASADESVVGSSPSSTTAAASTPDKPGTGGNLGLASMRERVRLAHGTLEIESAPGHGTIGHRVGAARAAVRVRARSSTRAPCRRPPPRRGGALGPPDLRVRVGGVVEDGRELLDARPRGCGRDVIVADITMRQASMASTRWSSCARAGTWCASSSSRCTVMSPSRGARSRPEPPVRPEAFGLGRADRRHPCGARGNYLTPQIAGEVLAR